ncbi:nucleoporin Nup186/Nup192/Nup205 [Lipomyces oligophaga]|uniref:nucleoporin Nup186/Nup192/Nup205 n=1 Tax=Lipomyces oligophaga TaxID=45792 RepID=UPI0034CE6B5E
MTDLIWSTEPFLRLNSLLVSSPDAAEDIEPLFNDLLSNLQNLLSVPPKSDSSRRSLVPDAVIVLESGSYKLNTEFVNEACLIADDLNIDEKVAANYLEYGRSSCEKLDRTPMQSGIILFHSRRGYLLESIRLILELAANPDNSAFNSLYQKFAKQLVTESFVGKAITTMADLRNVLHLLQEKETSGHFLGRDLDETFLENIKARREATIWEHEIMSQILSYSCRFVQITSSQINTFLDMTVKLESYDQLLVHYVVCVITFFDSITSPLSDGQPLSKAAIDEALVVQNYIFERQRKPIPTLSFFHSTIDLWWYVYFSGLCSREPDSTHPGLGKLDYPAEVFKPALISVMKNSSFEFMMVLAADMAVPSTMAITHLDLQTILQTKLFRSDPTGTTLESVNGILEPAKSPLQMTVLYSMHDSFDNLYSDTMTNLIDSIISNMADLLKELRYREEELTFGGALSEPASPSDPSSEDEFGLIDAEIERFFMFISYVYSGRSESARAFWSDPESNLFGFLTWSAQCQAPLMIATFCDMLGSLASGEESSQAVFKFLMDADEHLASYPPDLQQFRVSWSYVFESFSYYISQLQGAVPDQNIYPSSTASRSLIAIADLPELSYEDSILLSSHLRLLEQVARWGSAQTRNELLLPVSGINTYHLLFSLLPCRTQLTGAIFNAITAFTLGATRSERDAVWTELDSWLLQQQIVVSRTPSVLSATTSRSQQLSLRDRMHVLLTTFPDIQGFVLLLDCLTSVSTEDTINDIPFPIYLGSTYRTTPGIKPYIDFIIDEVFHSSTAADFSPRQRLALQVPCLRFILNCIQNFNTDLIALASRASSGGFDQGASGINIDNSLKPPDIRSYICLHPCVWVMEKMFEDKIYGVLFSIVESGLSILGESGLYQEQKSQSAQYALQVIHRILAIEDVYLDVLEPTVRTEVNTVTASRFGTSSTPRALLGLRDFEDAILFNIQVVTHVALYVNAENVKIASSAIKILDILAHSSQFLNTNFDIPVPGAYASNVVRDMVVKTAFNSAQSGRRLGVNRLLSALDTVSESRRIMFAFIAQLERPNDPYDDHDDLYQLKLEILEFLSRNLDDGSMTSKKPRSDEIQLPTLEPSSLSDIPTISHFLLGFKIGDGASAVSSVILKHNDDQGGVDSPVSLFRTIVDILLSHAGEVEEDGISGGLIAAPIVKSQDAAFSRAALEILFKLCTAKISSEVTLSLLRSSDYEFFKTRIITEMHVSIDSTRWGDICTFSGLMQNSRDQHDSSFEEGEEIACKTFLQFLSARTYLLGYTANELHSVSNPITSVFENYVKLLITAQNGQESINTLFICETAKMLELLDFLEFDIEKLAASWGLTGLKTVRLEDLKPMNYKVTEASGGVGVGVEEGIGSDLALHNELEAIEIFDGLRLDDACLYELSAVPSTARGSSETFANHSNEKIYDLERVEGVLELKICEQQLNGRLRRPAPESVILQKERILVNCRRYNTIVGLRRAQSQCLAAWCRLLRIILLDTAILDSQPDRIPGRDMFMLESMQVLGPKLLQYSHIWESRVAEHLSSACLSLISCVSPYLGLSDSSNEEEQEDDAMMDTAHGIFRVSLIVVQSPYATSSVRADLYTLINRFICNHSTQHRRKIGRLQKTIETNSNGNSQSDGLGTGPAKENRLVERIANDAVSGEGVTRVMSLIVLRSFAAIENVTGNYFVLEALVRYNLLLLIVRSIRRIDEELDDDNRVSNYEVTAYKAVMAFLIELAQSRAGAAEIIQTGLFRIIRQIKFLSIDPEVGIFTFGARQASGKTSSTMGTMIASSFWPTTGSSASGGSKNVFYELAAPTLRLLVCCVLSMGQGNLAVLKQVRETMSEKVLLMRYVLRRIVGLDISQKTFATELVSASGVTTGTSKGTVDEDEFQDAAVQESGKLIVLIANLTRGSTEDD